MTTTDGMETYVLKHGLRYGPYLIEELQEQLNDGFFGAQDFASIDENKTWIPLGEVPGISAQGFSVESHPDTNLLVIRYYGHVEADAVARCHARVREELRKLQRDFQLLVDLSELESMEPDCIAELERIMDECDHKGVTAVVRVIPDPQRDLGLQIMSFFHYRPYVRIVTCATIDEAMARLGL